MVEWGQFSWWHWVLRIVDDSVYWPEVDWLHHVVVGLGFESGVDHVLCGDVFSVAGWVLCIHSSQEALSLFFGKARLVHGFVLLRSGATWNTQPR